MTTTQTPANTSPSEDQPKDSTSSKPLKDSKFNELSTSLAFAITGLVVVYLPDLLGKSIDWRTEGRLLGIVLALVGAAFTLAAASKLTGRSGFGYWGFTIILGTVTAGIMSAVHVYHLPKWVAVTLIVVAVILAFTVVYAAVSGFTIFFDESEAVQDDSSEGATATAVQIEKEKRLSWYERITLIIAVISTVATLAAAIEPLIHP